MLGDRELLSICVDVRRDIVDMIKPVGSGHPGGSLSSWRCWSSSISRSCVCAPKSRVGRDAIGSSCPRATRHVRSTRSRAARLLSTCRAGATFDAPGTRLCKHIDMKRAPVVEVSKRIAGHGLSVAVGMALADLLDSRDRRKFAT